MTTAPTVSAPASEKYIVLRTYPSIDQEFALHVVLQAHGTSMDRLEGVYFKEDGLPSDGPGITILDVDAVMRYKGQFSSATLMQANEFGWLGQPGLSALCDVLANNNGTASNRQLGGYLKYIDRRFRPFAWLLRLVQHVDLQGLDRHRSLVTWIGEFQKVCATWFDYCRATLERPDDVPSIPYATLDRFAKAVPDLAERLDVEAFAEKQMKRPEGLLTLTGYLIALYALMSEEDWAQGGEAHLRETADFWIRAFQAGEQLESIAMRLAHDIADEVTAAAEGKPSRHAVVNTPAGRMAWIESDMDEVSGPLWERLRGLQINVIAARRSTGRVGILTRAGAGVDTSALARALQELEPDLWADEQRLGQGQAPAVLNGSKKIHRPSTKLDRATLIGLCRQHLKLKPREASSGDRRHRRGRR